MCMEEAQDKKGFFPLESRLKSLILQWEMKSEPVYLWSLPMFHCNGWTFTWGVAARGGTNVCIRNTCAEDMYHAITELRRLSLLRRITGRKIVKPSGSSELDTTGWRSSILAEKARRCPEIARMGELHTLQARTESALRLKNLDISIIQTDHTL